MKVLMTADTVGGIWTYAVQLCRSLERHGVEVALATMGAPLSAPQHAVVRGLRNVTVHESEFRLEWMSEPWDDVAAAGRWLLELDERFRPDVVHLNGYTHGALAWRAPVLVAGHSCVLSWWRAVHGSEAPPEWDRYRDAVTAGLQAADAVAAPTRAMLRTLIEDYGMPRRTRVIPNGCDSTWLPLGVRDAFGRYVGRAERRQPLVLGAGRIWDESKNLAALAVAAPAIHAPVHVAGADVDPSGRTIRLTGVNQLGMLPPAALQHWYRQASVFVQPSVYEPFGLAPLEAALAGCALVLGDIPSLREVWGDAAVYVPARRPAELAEAVNALLGDAARLSRYADAAGRRARTFTAARMARGYALLYRELARSGGRSPGPDPQMEVVACAS